MSTWGNPVMIGGGGGVSAADNGKVVVNGALVAQTARASEITANGTYDTTTNDSVTVNVAVGTEHGPNLFHPDYQINHIYNLPGTASITYNHSVPSVTFNGTVNAGTRAMLQYDLNSSYARMFSGCKLRIQTASPNVVCLIQKGSSPWTTYARAKKDSPATVADLSSVSDPVLYVIGTDKQSGAVASQDITFNNETVVITITGV